LSEWRACRPIDAECPWAGLANRSALTSASRCGFASQRPQRPRADWKLWVVRSVALTRKAAP
jgi:hypothetical protein